MLHDLRYAARTLLKRPGFTLVALMTLALGIGGGTMMFTVMNSIVLRPFPFLDTDGLVLLVNNQPYDKSPTRPLTPGNFVTARQRTDLFTSIGAFQAFYFNEPGEGRRPEQLFGQIVSAGFFEALGVRPILGRAIEAEDELPGNDNVVVLSHRLWMRRFSGDSTVVGRTFPLEGRNYRVIGVMPEGFGYPTNSEIWGAITVAAKDTMMREYYAYDVVARLRDGLDADQVTSRLAVKKEATRKGAIVAVPLLDASVREARDPVAIMAIAVCLVLLIACTNVANLLMSRSMARQREIAVRVALGAQRGRIVQGLLVESILLAIVGGGLGVLMAMWGIELLTTAIPVDVTRAIAGWSYISVDATALLFTLGLSIVTGVVFGLLPALQSSRLELSDALKEGNSMVIGGRRGAGFRNSLVVVEVAVALVLLIGAVLLIRTYFDLRYLDRGYRTDRVLSMEVSLPDSTYPGARDVTDFFDRAVARIRDVNGVEGVSVVSPHPAGAMSAIGYYKPMTPIVKDTSGAGPAASFTTIGSDFNHVFDIPLLAGRSFTRTEERERSRSLIVDERLACRHFGDVKQAIGQGLYIGNDTIACTIVGVVGEIRNVNDGSMGDGAIYIPFGLNARRTSSLAVRIRHDDPEPIMSALTVAIGRVDPNQAISKMRTVDEMISTQLVGRSLVTIAISLFAIIALLLAAVGIYSVIAHGIARRTHEIGLRIALGANERSVLGLVIRQGMLPVMIGVALGLALAIGVGASLLELVFGTTPADPFLYIGVAAGLVVVALLACYIPARRAVRVDPVVALRYE